VAWVRSPAESLLLTTYVAEFQVSTLKPQKVFCRDWDNNNHKSASTMEKYYVKQYGWPTPTPPSPQLDSTMTDLNEIYRHGRGPSKDCSCQNWGSFDGLVIYNWIACGILQASE
jgi:hypothetical protein